MKTTINNISTNPRYASEITTLNRLTKSLAEAQAEADRTGSLLAAWNPPTGGDAVSAALQMLDGKPAQNSMDILATERATALNKAKILKQAIEQQRVSMLELTSELSIVESTLHRAAHADAVRSIAAALKTLDDALGVEANLRERIEQAGYRCTLPAFPVPELGRLSYIDDSPMLRHHKAAVEYVADYEDDASGKLDKPNVVHLLVDVPGIGRVTEIVSIAGRMARQLVRLGRAEETNDKPRRAAKHTHSNREIVLE